MAPRTKFTKEQIIDAAFDIVISDGIDSITIRKVAEKMGSSIAPIYVNFKDVGELIQAVIHRGVEIGNQFIMEQNTGNPFHDIGRASLRFAKEYPVLFRDLVMKSNHHMNHYEDEMSVLLELMKKDPDLEGFNDEELKDILLKMRVFQTGLSVMAANGLLPKDMDEEGLYKILESTGRDVIEAAHMRKKNESKASL